MPSNKRVLIVEGDSDASLLTDICVRIDLKINIIAPPKALGGKANTKQGVFNLLKNNIINQIQDGHFTHVGIIVDADYKDAHGLGFEGTKKQIDELISQFNFKSPTRIKHSTGLSYHHNDGLNPFGAFIMPNNKDEGMTEDWIKTSIIDSEKQLYDLAESTIHKIIENNLNKFGEIHSTKKSVATWLTWQEVSKQGLVRLLDENNPLVNYESKTFKDLECWLTSIYAN